MDFHNVALAGESETFRPDRERAQQGNALGDFIAGKVGVLVREVAADGVLVFLAMTFDRLQRRAPRAVEEVVEETQWNRIDHALAERDIAETRAFKSESQEAARNLRIVSAATLCHCERMEITVTKPIEEFINRQLTKGYADASEVARQAFLRWMEEEEFDADPPELREKLAEARQGRFRPYDAKAYDALLASGNETSR